MSEIASTKARKRCAVYCRVSSDERLDQEFNSIDAQKEAGHAYVASQRSEGWIPVADDYDDPGFSGGNTERPGLKRLMADIERGQIDIVVVYKIDRLTRSLADFSKMVEVFERHGVSFVSVTQQFNTTTSMGRLMLNVLLSFAQFEREVTGERIRDKIAASKRKGMWMGGVPPLGYDVENRRLVPNEREAKLIRHIFQRFVELGSSTALVKELKLDGVTSKAWTTQDGKTRDGRSIDKGHIYKLLSNRTYLGELRHKDQWYQAEHPPIISRELWDSVHAILETNGRVRGNTTRAKVPYLLKGIVFGNDGRALSPWHTTKKNGRRYRYYVPQRDAKEHAGASGASDVRVSGVCLNHQVRSADPVREIAQAVLHHTVVCRNHHQARLRLHQRAHLVQAGLRLLRIAVHQLACHPEFGRAQPQCGHGPGHITDEEILPPGIHGDEKPQ